MVNLSRIEARKVEIYARAMADISEKLTGDRRSGKSYDPMTVSGDGTIMHSYAFDMKDGRQRLRERRGDFFQTLLNETVAWIKEDDNA